MLALKPNKGHLTGITKGHAGPTACAARSKKAPWRLAADLPAQGRWRRGLRPTPGTLGRGALASCLVIGNFHVGGAPGRADRRIGSRSPGRLRTRAVSWASVMRAPDIRKCAIEYPSTARRRRERSPNCSRPPSATVRTSTFFSRGQAMQRVVRLNGSEE